MPSFDGLLVYGDVAILRRPVEGRGLFVTIAVEGDQLSLQVDGRQKLMLSADADNKFSLPAGAGQFTFTKTAAGQVSYELRRANGTTIKGARVPPGL
jgi:hypothetical protein